MNSVLFVCSANMCRSPMAEVLFKNLLFQQGAASKWFIYSAGVWAREGNRATEGAMKAMHRKGIDLGLHRSRIVSESMINEYDLILVMEKNHKDALRAAFPEFSSKIYLLSEMVGLSYDILDPIGGTAADYDYTADELEKLLADSFNRIKDLVIDQEDLLHQ